MAPLSMWPGMFQAAAGDAEYRIVIKNSTFIEPLRELSSFLIKFAHLISNERLMGTILRRSFSSVFLSLVRFAQLAFRGG